MYEKPTFFQFLNATGRIFTILIVVIGYLVMYQLYKVYSLQKGNNKSLEYCNINLMQYANDINSIPSSSKTVHGLDCTVTRITRDTVLNDLIISVTIKNNNSIPFNKDRKGKFIYTAQDDYSGLNNDQHEFSDIRVTKCIYQPNCLNKGDTISGDIHVKVLPKSQIVFPMEVKCYFVKDNDSFYKTKNPENDEYSLRLTNIP